MNIIYFGAGAFAVAPLRALASNPDIKLLAVVTRPDRPVGREKKLVGTPVAVTARELVLTLIQPESFKDGSVETTLSALNADVFIVASYGKIVPQSILDLPRLGCLNLHGSILPAYRGASPIQSAIAAGEVETGVSLMKMDAEVDHGPVYATATTPIEKNDTHDSLELKLGDVAADLLMMSLPMIANGSMAPIEQDHSAATFTKIIEKEDGLVRWAEEPATQIERKLRAYTPWPGIYTILTKGETGKESTMRLKLLEVAIDHNSPADIAPGTHYIASNGYPAIRAHQAGLILTKVQPEGKPPMDGKAFLNGHKNWVK